MIFDDTVFLISQRCCFVQNTLRNSNHTYIVQKCSEAYFAAFYFREVHLFEKMNDKECNSFAATQGIRIFCIKCFDNSRDGSSKQFVIAVDYVYVINFQFIFGNKRVNNLFKFFMVIRFFDELIDFT